MKTTFALGAFAALCQVAYSLESGTYQIVSAMQLSPPPPPIGLNDDGPKRSLVLGGTTSRWTFIKALGKENVFTISQNGIAVQCDRETCYVGSPPTPEQHTFWVQEQNDDTYTIELPFRIQPYFAWTISGTAPGSKVELRFLEQPTPEQKFRLIPQE
ncbi:hypothetical protein AJ78_05420 [Emergomyces pasteurianus Ep9510]|uniref:Uncharacterized protein n=1 Tax=Emergomyces pasteurianus Ep9510 TaxID=1447872 RepID=A0A1J9PDV4_9EURO|nr:hypothetical protein AJ78_05420 [Emergomyces pasteurianus Ep9510]